MIRVLQLNLALLCCLAGAAFARPACAVTVEQEPGGLRVHTAAYSALVDTANGGRITSLRADGSEMTRLCADGHGGLFEETHSADFPFEVLRQESDGPRLVLALAAKVGALRIIKEFTFSDEQPSFTVRLTFENASPFAMSGADAPALRNLVLPAGGLATGRELYCTARTRGAEVLSADFLLARTYAAGAAPALRWMAVSEPAARRALGFALLQAGSRPLPPLRAQGGGLLTGWSVPAVPAGSSLSVSVLVVPLPDFTAVAELNAHFAADAVLDISGAAPVIHLSLMPIEALPDLSIVTRTYDADGHELEPCDPLLLAQPAPYKLRQGDVACPAGSHPAWYVHEVYSSGRKLSTFAVPVGQPAGPSPSAAERLPDAVAAALPGAPQPGASIPLTPERTRLGFLLWPMDGPPATDEAQDVHLALAAGDRTTVFFGLRALERIASFQLSLVPAGAGGGADVPSGTVPVPASAVYLWRVMQDSAGLAHLVPFDSASMKKDEIAWLALTADSSRLAPGRYAARLVAEADGRTRELPLDVRVIAAPGGTAGGFGLWYLGSGDVEPVDGPTLQKLTDYGVRALTLPLDDSTAAAVRSGLPEAQFGRMRMLAFAGSGGVLAPAGPAPGALPLPCPDPLWMLRVGASTAAAVRATSQAAFSPALLCERLAAVPQEFFDAAGKGTRPVWLVEDGVEPEAVPRLISSGALDARTPVWLYLDLRGVDWRAAAIRVRSAVWAAAWQGLAGLAVTCDPPAAQVDRQLALWHVLHDACREAALWRRADRAGVAAGVVGPEDGSMLALQLERAPFRKLYRVAPAGAEGVSLKQFADARLRTVELAAPLGSAPPAAGPGRLYWRGIPLLEDGRVRWTIFVPTGQDQAQRAALSFQQALTKLAGSPVPLVHDWPASGPDAPALVWAFTDEAGWPALPGAVRAAGDKRSGAAFLTADLEGGAAAVVVRPGMDQKMLLDALLPVPDLYPTAGGVK